MKMSNSPGKRERCFTPGHFLELLECEHCTIEWFITTMRIRDALHASGAAPHPWLAHEVLALTLKLRAHQLRN
jgi:hypothetical protein